MFDQIITVLFYLIVGHALADYPLQNRFMAIGKNPYNQEVDSTSARKWYHKMAAHCAIHGGMVMLITGSWGYGLLEFVLHWIIDIHKCDKRINSDVDQALHILCKVLYVIMIFGFQW